MMKVIVGGAGDVGAAVAHRLFAAGRWLVLHDEPGLAPLTIGLGPGFEAGRHADVVVETAWGRIPGA